MPPLLVLLLSLALAGPASGEDHTVTQDALVVEPGQTAWSIAHAHGVTVEDLLGLNGLSDPTELQAGAVLRIPQYRNPVVAEPKPRLQEASRDTRRSLLWPLRGRLTSLYGRRRRALHAGLDISASSGTIVTAAAEGRVVRAGKAWGRYGKVVLIEHREGWSTLYAHASRVFVGEGEQVSAGQAIAAVGRTGNATGPHLHFELWEGDRTIDPLRYLGPVDEGWSAALLK